MQLLVRLAQAALELQSGCSVLCVEQHNNITHTNTYIIHTHTACTKTHTNTCIYMYT